MTKTELIERIEVWLSLQNQIPLPPPQSATGAALQAQVNRAWAAAELRNVVALAPGVDVAGPEAEPSLTAAIAFAQTGDASKLPEIVEHLKKAHGALRP